MAGESIDVGQLVSTLSLVNSDYISNANVSIAKAQELQAAISAAERPYSVGAPGGGAEAAAASNDRLTASTTRVTAARQADVTTAAEEASAVSTVTAATAQQSAAMDLLDQMASGDLSSTQARIDAEAREAAAAAQLETAYQAVGSELQDYGALVEATAAREAELAAQDEAVAGKLAAQDAALAEHTAGLRAELAAMDEAAAGEVTLTGARTAETAAITAGLSPQAQLAGLFLSQGASEESAASGMLNYGFSVKQTNAAISEYLAAQEQANAVTAEAVGPTSAAENAQALLASSLTISVAPAQAFAASMAEAALAAGVLSGTEAGAIEGTLGLAAAEKADADAKLLQAESAGAMRLAQDALSSQDKVLLDALNALHQAQVTSAAGYDEGASKAELLRGSYGRLSDGIDGARVSAANLSPAMLALAAAMGTIISLDFAGKLEADTVQIANFAGITDSQATAAIQNLNAQFGLGVNSAVDFAAALAPVAGIIEQATGATLSEATAESEARAGQELSVSTREKLASATRDLVEVQRMFIGGTNDAKTVEDALYDSTIKDAQSLDQIKTAYGLVNAQLGALKPSLSDVKALVDAAAQSGSDSSRVLNELTSGLANLTNGSKASEAALKLFNVQTTDSNGQLLSTSQIIHNVVDAIDQYVPAEQAKAAAQLLGSSNGEKDLATLRVVDEEYRTGKTDTDNYANASKAAADQAATLGGVWDHLKSSGKDFLTFIGTELVLAFLEADKGAMTLGLHIRELESNVPGAFGAAARADIAGYKDALAQVNDQIAKFSVTGTEAYRTGAGLAATYHDEAVETNSAAAGTEHLAAAGMTAAQIAAAKKSAYDAETRAIIDNNDHKTVLAGLETQLAAAYRETGASREADIQSIQRQIAIETDNEAQATKSSKAEVTGTNEVATAQKAAAVNASALATAETALANEQVSKSQVVTQAMLADDKQKVQSALSSAQAALAAWQTASAQETADAQARNVEQANLDAKATSEKRASFEEQSKAFTQAKSEETAAQTAFDQQQKASAAEAKREAEEAKTEASDRAAITDAIAANVKKLNDDARTAAEQAKTDAEAIAAAIDTVYKKLADDTKQAAQQAKADAASIVDAEKAVSDAQAKASEDAQSANSTGIAAAPVQQQTFQAQALEQIDPLLKAQQASQQSILDGINSQIASETSVKDQAQAILDAETAHLQTLQQQSSELSAQVSLANDLLAASGQTDTTDQALLALQVQRDQLVVGGQSTTEIDKQIAAEQAKNKLASDNVALQDVGLQKQIAQNKVQQDSAAIGSAQDAAAKQQIADANTVLAGLNAQASAQKTIVDSITGEVAAAQAIVDADNAQIAASNAAGQAAVDAANQAAQAASQAASTEKAAEAQRAADAKTAKSDAEAVQKAQDALTKAQVKGSQDAQAASDKYAQDAVDGAKKIGDAQTKAAQDADNAEHKYEEDAVAGAERIDDANKKLHDDIAAYLSDPTTGAFAQADSAAETAFNHISDNFDSMAKHLTEGSTALGQQIGANINLGITVGESGTPGGTSGAANVTAAGADCCPPTTGTWTINLVLPDGSVMATAVTSSIGCDLALAAAGSAPAGI